MQKSTFKYNIALVLAAALWGISFVFQKQSTIVGTFTVNFIRSLIGSAVLVPVVIIKDRIEKDKPKSYNNSWSSKELLVGGSLCGLALCAACNAQQLGLSFGTPSAKSGFITALYIIIVPLLSLVFHKKVGINIWISVALALVGFALLSLKFGDGPIISSGDLVTLLCALLFSFHIMIVDKYADITDGVKLSCIQFLVCGILSGVLTFIFEDPTWSAIKSGGISILYLGICSCGVAYTLQIIGQKGTQPAVATLLMSLESVFAAIAGSIAVIIGYESGGLMETRQVIGCVLVFIAVVLAELPKETINKIFKKEKINV